MSYLLFHICLLDGSESAKRKHQRSLCDLDANRRLPVYIPLALRGIEARQVETTGEGNLQFEPCYFEPHPEKVLPEYPINVAANMYDVRRLDCFPTLEDALGTVQETIPPPESPLKAAQKLLEKRLEEYHY